MPIRSLAMYITSASAMADTTDDSLMRKITLATTPGMEVLMACGMTTRLNVCHLLKPSTYADSRCTSGMVSKPPRIASAI